MVDARLIPPTTVFILYGATGDLSHRLVLPALYNLAMEGLLPEDWRIVGTGRGDVAHEDFQERVRHSLEEFGPKPATGFGASPAGGNVITFELSSAGEIDLSLVAKRPGPELTLGSAHARLPLGKAFHTPALPAYARLIHDVLLGDRSLFTRPDGLAHVWKVAGALLAAKPEPIPYPPGSWGPNAWPAGAPAMLKK